MFDRPALCLPDHCFCEAIRWNAPILQPSNTWSNLAFVAIGLSILLFSRARAYGLIVVFLGVGSALFHATLTFVGQWLDLMSMFFLPTYFILVNLLGASPLAGQGPASLPRARPVLLYWLLVNAALGAQLFFFADGRYVFAGLVVVLIVTEVFARRRTKRPLFWLLAAAGSMAAAFTIWTLDIKHIVCDPYATLQGHAAWHVLSAVAAGCLFFYYRPEKLPAPAVATTIAS